MFVGEMAPGEIGASAQAIFFVATNGIGMLLGTWWAGVVMEHNAVAGKVQWARIWTVPLTGTFAGAVVFAIAFKTPHPAEFRRQKPHSLADSDTVSRVDAGGGLT
jgi:hypothetical protein